jgi:hypothetical protein
LPPEIGFGTRRFAVSTWSGAAQGAAARAVDLGLTKLACQAVFDISFYDLS